MPLVHQRNQIPTDPNFSSLRRVDRLYAYLQTISQWDGIKNEPRYIKKEDYSTAKIAKALDRSTRTIQRQLLKLKDSGYVREEDDKIYLDLPTVYTTVNPKTLIALYQTSTDDVINVFAFMRWIYVSAEKKGRPATFVKSYILKEVLGISANGQAYERLDNIINDIVLKGLVELKMTYRVTEDGNRFQEYTITNFSDTIAQANVVVEEDLSRVTETVEEMTERLNKERQEFHF